MRKFNLRITAVFLLLVLSQNLGLRLVLHNKFHKAIAYAASSKTTNGDVQMHCDCLDEALMPLAEANTVELAVPEKELVIAEKTYLVFLTSTSKIFHSLRAPPVA